MDGFQLHVALFKYHYVLVVFFEGLHVVSKGLGPGKATLLAEETCELHALHEVAHPLLAEVAAGEAEGQNLRQQLQLQEV